MTLAIILVVAAVVTLILIVRITVSGRLQAADASLAESLQPVDIEAFRNLADPAETAYLQRRLPSAEFRSVQRQRLRAMASYLEIAGRNAAALVVIGQRAVASHDVQTAEAARRLVESALLLRRNTAFALFRIRIALAWPIAGPAAPAFLSGYEKLSAAAMLLGRLQHPGVPVRLSAG
jgi:hypothetical protein